MEKSKRKKKGFTLIELIIVIAILGILAAIAIPRYNMSKVNAAKTAHNTNVQMLKNAGEMKKFDNPNEEIKWPDGGGYSEYIDKWPEVPKGIGLDNEKYTVTYEGNNGEIKVETAATDNN